MKLSCKHYVLILSLLVLAGCSSTTPSASDKAGDPVPIGPLPFLPTKISTSGNIVMAGDLNNASATVASPHLRSGSSVFANCVNGQSNSSPCTATATCPVGMVVDKGFGYYILTSKAGDHGGCGAGEEACEVGAKSCSIKTEKSWCHHPDWAHQVVAVHVVCKVNT